MVNGNNKPFLFRSRWVDYREFNILCSHKFIRYCLHFPLYGRKIQLINRTNIRSKICFEMWRNVWFDKSIFQRTEFHTNEGAPLPVGNLIISLKIIIEPFRNINTLFGYWLPKTNVEKTIFFFCFASINNEFNEQIFATFTSYGFWGFNFKYFIGVNQSVRGGR